MGTASNRPYVVASTYPTPAEVVMPDDANEPFEAYVDGFSLGVTPYTFILDFNVRTGGEATDIRQAARLRMSPEHAKMLAILFRRGVREYEEQAKVQIALPPELLSEKDINLEYDW